MLFSKCTIFGSNCWPLNGEPSASHAFRSISCCLLCSDGSSPKKFIELLISIQVQLNLNFLNYLSIFAVHRTESGESVLELPQIAHESVVSNQRFSNPYHPHVGIVSSTKSLLICLLYRKRL